MAYRSQIGGQSGKVLIDAVMAERGPMTQARAVPSAVIAHYETRLPPLLLDVWENHGIGDLAGGLLRLCIPGAYAEPLATLFDGDLDFAGDTHVVAHSPFGDLLVWSERHALMFISMAQNFVDAPFLTQHRKTVVPDQLVLDHVLGMHAAALNMADDAGTPMFDAALAQHGPLQPHQIYGMMPPASFGASIAVDALAVTDGPSWFQAKLSSTGFALADVANAKFGLRPIGPPLTRSDR